MGRKFISYDLSEDEHYDSLYKCLDSLGAIEATKSFYIIKDSSLSNEQIVKAIIGATTRKIKVLVDDMPAGAYWNNVDNSDKWKK